jgi:hypothetical protein
MKKVNLNLTYAYEDFITNEEKNIILFWIINNNDKFTENLSADRKFVFVRDINGDVYDLIQTLRNRIIYLENIVNYKKLPIENDYIGINTTGGKIHMHTDSNIDNYIHNRYNVILSYPEEGGESIYGGHINKLKENMVWKCIAGQIMHGSNVIIGEKPRITLSIGFYIKQD